MNKPLYYTLTGLLLGAVLGAWGMRFYFDQTLGSWNASQRFLVQLSQDLKLKPDQQAQVAEILKNQKTSMEALRRQWRFQVFTLDREGEDAIGRVLTDSQTDAFMSIHDRIHGQMDRFLWSMESGPTAIALAPGKP
jgi:hypothetical protein